MKYFSKLIFTIVQCICLSAYGANEIGTSRVEIAKENLKENQQINKIIDNDPTINSAYFKRCEKYTGGGEYAQRMLHRDSVKYDYFNSLLKQTYTNITDTEALIAEYQKKKDDSGGEVGHMDPNANPEGFIKVDKEERDLTGETNNLFVAIGGISLKGEHIDKELQAQRLKNLEDDIKQAEAELKAKEQAYKDAAAVCTQFSGCTPEQQERLNIALSEKQIAKAKFDQAVIAHKKFQAEILQMSFAYGSQNKANAYAISAQGHATYELSKNTRDKAKAQGNVTEKEYNDLIREIRKAEQINAAAMDVANKRLAELETQRSFRKDYELYKLATIGYNDEYYVNCNDGSVKCENRRITREMALSNMEVITTAAAGIYQLKCEDIKAGDCQGGGTNCYPDSSSYPLFKAAAATYLAAQMNDTVDYKDITRECIMKCVPVEEVKKDRNKYPGFENTDFDDVVPVCKTADGQPGLYTQDFNADMDKDEQFRSLLRAAALNEEYINAAEIRVANRTKAMEMFRAAHAAALTEVSNKQTRVMAAKSELEKAKAWQQNAQKNMWLAMLLMAPAMMMKKVSCKKVAGKTVDPVGCAFAKAEIAFWKMIFGIEENEHKMATADRKKWEKKLKEAKLHGHMKCNYPGADADIAALDKEFPLIYNKSVLDSLLAYHPTIINDDKSMIASLIEWSQMMKGKVQSLPYYSKLPSKKDIEITMKLSGFNGNYKKIIETLVHSFLVNDALAKMDNEQQAETLGINVGTYNDKQGANFNFFLKMKLGAWQLQSHNASKLVDLNALVVTTDGLYPNLTPGQSLYKFIRYNKSKHEGRVIENTGFPVPETRAVYLGAVVEMLLNNITTIANDSLPKLINQKNQYAKLINHARHRMTVGVTGHEDDDTVLNPDKQGKCFKGDENNLEVDASCNCAATNSCANFQMPKFDDTIAPNISKSSTLSFKSTNSLLGGNIKGFNSDGKKLVANSKNLQAETKKASDQVFTNQREAIKSKTPGILEISKSNRSSSKRRRGQNTQSGSSIDTTNNANKEAFLPEDDKKTETNEKDDKQSKNFRFKRVVEGNTINLVNPAANKKATTESKKEKIVKIAKDKEEEIEKTIEEEISFDDIDLDGDGEIDAKKDPLTGEIIALEDYEELKKEIKKQIKEKGYFSRLTLTETLENWRKQANKESTKGQNGSEIHDASHSLFDIISDQYQESFEQSFNVKDNPFD